MAEGLQFARLITPTTSANQNPSVNGSALHSLLSVSLVILAKQHQNVPPQTVIGMTDKKQQSIGCWV